MSIVGMCDSVAHLGNTVFLLQGDRFPGSMGPKGFPGYQGTKGAPGPAGSRGSGFPGRRGPNGRQGDQGGPGSEGIPGRPGPPGEEQQHLPSLFLRIVLFVLSQHFLPIKKTPICQRSKVAKVWTCRRTYPS